MRFFLIFEKKIYKLLEKQDIITHDQAQLLLVALKESFKRNEEIAHQLEQALQKLHDMESRINFYRSLHPIKKQK